LRKYISGKPKRVSYSTLASAVFGDVRNYEHHEITMELKAKLKLIRDHLELTQNQMAQRLGLISESRRARVSEWEAGKGEPNRAILIKYAELANLDIRKLIDDREDL
jgi:DNA-binding XRE family transcriptional regulator